MASNGNSSLNNREQKERRERGCFSTCFRFDSFWIAFVKTLHKTPDTYARVFNRLAHLSAESLLFYVTERIRARGWCWWGFKPADWCKKKACLTSCTYHEPSNKNFGWGKHMSISCVSVSWKTVLLLQPFPRQSQSQRSLHTSSPAEKPGRYNNTLGLQMTLNLNCTTSTVRPSCSQTWSSIL